MGVVVGWEKQVITLVNLTGSGVVKAIASHDLRFTESLTIKGEVRDRDSTILEVLLSLP